MFHYIEGTVDSLAPNLAVIDCGGIGFALSVSNNTLTGLSPGERARLYTYLYLREDAMELFGFFNRQEKACFEKLIGVSGVGPRAALAILSYNTPAGLAFAVASGNEKALTVVPGIGKKIAQRVLLELKDKLGVSADDGAAASGLQPVSPPQDDRKLADATQALTTLGYSAAEIHEALRQIDLAALPLEAIIKAALKNMMR
ncbi:MAG: Holliday junction branch migration protein RuvA [Clostridiales bacterium]|nr:Holliday junction branch migration protein RuvA [Clostridiales bacterium]